MSTDELAARMAQHVARIESGTLNPRQRKRILQKIGALKKKMAAKAGPVAGENEVAAGQHSKKRKASRAGQDNTTKRAIEQSLGCNVSMREKDGSLLATDNGNFIADAHTGPTLTHPEETERKLLNLAGVVQVGLFNNMCDVVVLASSDGVSVLEKGD